MNDNMVTVAAARGREPAICLGAAATLRSRTSRIRPDGQGRMAETGIGCPVRGRQAGQAGKMEG